MSVSAEAAPPPASSKPWFVRFDYLPAVTGMALLLGICRRVIGEYGQPLWFDELFAAAIATEPDFHSLINAALHELSGPVYYLTLWSWVKVAGDSNLALRIPSIVCSIAAPLVILCWGHPDRRIRMIWAGLIALWLPIVYLADDAKPYSLLILLTVGQTIALGRHLRRPSTSAIMTWSCLSALMILTHYHAMVVTGLQAIVILCRGRAAFRWRAILPFLPVGIWMWWHFGLILSFAHPATSWYGKAGTSSWVILPEALTGMTVFSGIQFMLTTAGTAIWAMVDPRLRQVRDAFDKWDVAIVMTGLGAICAVLAVTLVLPSFMPRYLLPFLVSVLFGVAQWANAWSRRLPIFGAALIFVFLILASREIVNRLDEHRKGPRNPMNFAAASRFIGDAHPSRLVFLWDCPSAGAPGVPLFDRVAGFELARAGHAVPVDTLIPPRNGEDPNYALLRMASRPEDAILWTYDVQIHDTLAARHPPAIAKLDPRWTCHDFGHQSVTVLACVQRPPVAMAGRAASSSTPEFRTQ